MNVRFEGNTLYIENREVRFSRPINEILLYDNTIVVQLEYHDPNNIYGIDEKARVIWQVQDSGKVYSYNNDDSYVGISRVDDGHIKGITFDCLYFIINIKNGEIEGMGYTK